MHLSEHPNWQPQFLFKLPKPEIDKAVALEGWGCTGQGSERSGGYVSIRTNIMYMCIVLYIYVHTYTSRDASNTSVCEG